MADNVTAPAAGVIFATDELTGAVHWPYAKLAFGADGSAVPVADANGARLPVLATLAGTPPVAVQTLATTSRAYGASQRIATSGAGSVRTAAGIAATEVTLIATVDGFAAVGDGTVAAADAAGSFPVFAGLPFTLQITSGQFIAFIRAGSTDGSLFILPVA